MAQFRSFVDPFLIMLAIPMGFIGVLVILPLVHSTLNVMSLMGVLMLIGIAGSNSILIVDFAHKLEGQGLPVADAVITACRVRLRPILMTSLATIIGMIPMAMKLGTGAEQYAPMAQAIIGGLTSSVLLTIFIVPAAYLLVYGRRRPGAGQAWHRRAGSAGSGGSLMRLTRFILAGAWTISAFGQAGAPVQLKLSDAEAMALKNHPQVLAAQNETSGENQRIVEARSAYYPSVNGEVTGSGGNHGSADRRGLHLRFPAVQPFRRRRGNQPAHQRFRAHIQPGLADPDCRRAPREQNYQATRYDVLLRVNQAYFNALRSQALVKVAQKTVSARQLLATRSPSWPRITFALSSRSASRMSLFPRPGCS